MILNYVLLFIIGVITGAVAVAVYVRKKMGMLQADLLDKTLITRLIKEQLPKRSNKPYKKRYNGRAKKKKVN
tara:strand:- start:2357 stop:2572 length:216 start_codon:yes stop_codon:yes gene_type:complete